MSTVSVHCFRAGTRVWSPPALQGGRGSQCRASRRPHWVGHLVTLAAHKKRSCTEWSGPQCRASPPCCLTSQQPTALTSCIHQGVSLPPSPFPSLPLLLLPSLLPPFFPSISLPSPSFPLPPAFLLPP